jgi:tetratricopeptide (TPR) repeat protein
MATIPEILALAIQHHQAGRLQAAEQGYRQVLALEPDQIDALHLLGVVAYQAGKHEVAIKYIGRAIGLKGTEAAFHSNLGNAFRGLGRLDEAVACYRRAIELKPDYAEARSNLGNALTCLGKLDEAVACYRQVVELGLGGVGSDSLGDAFLQLATILQGRLPADDLRAMERLSSQSTLGEDARAALEFGLAQALDARGAYDEAAEHLVKANAARRDALKKQQRAYDPAEYHAFIDNILAIFTPPFFARVDGFGLETELPVFIVGLPRSGTTLAEQILASHSLVFGANELHYCEETLQSLPGALRRGESPLGCLATIDRPTTRRLAQQHLDRLQALAPRAARIVDKMPENYHYLGFIRLLFPRARLIHCRRDLRDVALSCWKTNLVSMPWACDPDQIVSHFEEYLRVVDHWRSVLPLPPLDVDYEELIGDTEGVARRMVQWCGLEWEPACLRFYETQRAVRTSSAAQVRCPIYTKSLGAWRNYERPLGELFSRLPGGKSDEGRGMRAER